MDLPSSFHFKGWTIKYQLTTPSSSSINADTARTIVFVHGTPWSSTVYEPLARALSATGSCRILLYDLPGYGQSQTFSDDSTTSAPNASTSSPSNRPTFPGQTSISFQSSALAALLTHLSLSPSLTQHPSPPHIIAHDIAGAIVLRAHLLHNLEFADMLLLDTNAVLPWGDGFYQLARAQPEVFLKMPPDVYEAVVGAVVRSACFGRAKGWEEVLVQPWLDREQVGESGVQQQAQQQQQQQDKKSKEQQTIPPEEAAAHKRRQIAFIRQIAEANDADVREMLDADAYGRVRCDVRIIWGEEDRWIPRWKIEELAGRLGDRHKGTVLVPDAGHLVMLDQPERVAVEVFRWLERVN